MPAPGSRTDMRRACPDGATRCLAGAVAPLGADDRDLRDLQLAAHHELSSSRILEPMGLSESESGSASLRTAKKSDIGSRQLVSGPAKTVATREFIRLQRPQPRPSRPPGI